MELRSCPVCRRLVDLETTPVKKQKLPPVDGRKGYVQEDIMCPSCGSLVSRGIDGVEVTADGGDPREKIAPAKVTPDEG